MNFLDADLGGTPSDEPSLSSSDLRYGRSDFSRALNFLGYGLFFDQTSQALSCLCVYLWFSLIPYANYYLMSEYDEVSSFFNSERYERISALVNERVGGNTVSNKQVMEILLELTELKMITVKEALYYTSFVSFCNLISGSDDPNQVRPLF